MQPCQSFILQSQWANDVLMLSREHTLLGRREQTQDPWGLVARRWHWRKNRWRKGEVGGSKLYFPYLVGLRWLRAMGPERGTVRDGASADAVTWGSAGESAMAPREAVVSVVGGTQLCVKTVPSGTSCLSCFSGQQYLNICGCTAFQRQKPQG